MKAVKSREEWEIVCNSDLAIVMISRSTCEDCERVERELESNTGKVAEIKIHRIQLDCAESESLIADLPWIAQEVDVIPFWTVFRKGQRVANSRTQNLAELERIVKSHSLG